MQPGPRILPIFDLCERPVHTKTGETVGSVLGYCQIVTCNHEANPHLSGGRWERPSHPAHAEQNTNATVVRRTTRHLEWQLMPFSDLTKQLAFARSGGRCECQRILCSEHVLKSCGKNLTMATAEFHHKHAQSQGGSDALSNCEVLCHACHVNTASYGRS